MEEKLYCNHCKHEIKEFKEIYVSTSAYKCSIENDKVKTGEEIYYSNDDIEYICNYCDNEFDNEISKKLYNMEVIG